MKKTFKLENLDCAVCAGKIEEAVKRLDGVKDASVSFIAQKFTVETDDEDIDELFARIKKTAHNIEPDCQLIR